VARMAGCLGMDAEQIKRVSLVAVVYCGVTPFESGVGHVAR
jgi:hypothetical protein